MRKIVSLVLAVIFSAQTIAPSTALAQLKAPLDLPAAGSMIATTPAYVPLTLKGLSLHSDDALKFDFLMDTGHSALEGDALKDNALTIMKYFMAALTVPEEDLWVNLSPYEKGRVVESNFGSTLMGRDLLAEDYVLKQLTASLVYPEEQLGKEFWKEVYQTANQNLGTAQIPVNTFNKVWIVPAEAVIWEHDGKALIVKSRLKVMLEEDYLSLDKNKGQKPVNQSGSDAVRKLVIPVLEKEVNEGKHFAKLRQMYQAMILATWYKKALKESIVNKVYADQKKVKGIDNVDAAEVEQIFQQYVTAFKKGAFNYIKEEADPATGQNVPRKYFSGGFSLKNGATTLATALLILGALLTPAQAKDVKAASANVGQTIVVEGGLKEVVPPEDGTKEIARLNKASTINQLPEAKKYIRDSRRMVRLAAAEAMKRIGDEDAVPDLIGCLSDGASDVRAAAANALITVMKSAHSFKLLIKALNDAEKAKSYVLYNQISKILEDLKHPAGDAIYEFDGVSWVKEQKPKPDPRDSAMIVRTASWAMALLMSGALTPSEAKERVQYPDASPQEIARVEQLGNMADQSAYPELVKRLNDKSRIVRSLAAVGLGRVGDEKALPHLLRALSDGASDVRTSAQEAIYKILRSADGYKQVIVALNAAEKSRNYILYNEISEILKTMRHPAGWYIYELKDNQWAKERRPEDDFAKNDNVAPLLVTTEAVESAKKDTAMITGIQALEILVVAGSIIGGAALTIEWWKNRRVKKSIEASIDQIRTNIRLGVDQSEAELTAAVSDIVRRKKRLHFGEGYVYERNLPSEADIQQAAQWIKEGFAIDVVYRPEQGHTEASYTHSGNDYPYIVDSPARIEIVKGDQVARDLASVAKVTEVPVGGIDLDAKLMGLQIKRDGKGVPLPLSQQPLDQINIQGFLPVIFNIKPVDLPKLLGIGPSDSALALAS